MKQQIAVLPDDVRAHIAAGQVIDGPATVVKELVDNALDAGATTIKVELTTGGLDTICVTDNGSGMHRDDLALAFMPHTTSKLASLDDLLALQTKGFRGEALASIVTAADVEIASRTVDAETGWEVAIHKRQPSELRPRGMPVGTRVCVSSLFADLPARKKFLRKPQTEYRAVTEIMNRFAFANVGVHFELLHNNQRVFSVAAHHSLLDRVAELLHLENEMLVAIEADDGHTHVTGYIAKPQYSIQKKQSYIFINGHSIVYHEIGKIIKQAYGTLLEPHAQPFFLISITVSPASVDINIDPKKERAHIYHLESLLALIYDTVKEELDKESTRYNVETPFMTLGESGMEYHTASILRKRTQPWSLKDLQLDHDVAQFHNVYLITQTENGIIFIDQHAAHERILYEQFLDEFQQERELNNRVTLKHLQTFSVTTHERSLLEQYAQTLHAHGFKYSVENDNTVCVTTVPRLFEQRDLKLLLLELCEDFEMLLPSEKIDLVSHKTIAYLACRTAIKAGEALTLEERKNLLQKLGQTKTQYTCPHGRPVQLEMSIAELEKLFHRR